MMRRSRMPGRKVFITIFAAILAGCFLVPNLAGQAQSGRDIYLDKCAVCHGEDGAGKTIKGKKVHCKDIRDTIKKDSEADMIKVVTDGKGVNMDSYKKQLSPEQVRAVVEYYRSLAK